MVNSGFKRKMVHFLGSYKQSVDGLEQSIFCIKKALIFGAMKRFLYKSRTTQKNALTLFENYHRFYKDN